MKAVQWQAFQIGYTFIPIETVNELTPTRVTAYEKENFCLISAESSLPVCWTFKLYHSLHRESVFSYSGCNVLVMKKKRNSRQHCALIRIFKLKFLCSFLKVPQNTCSVKADSESGQNHSCQYCFRMLLCTCNIKKKYQL